MLPVFPKLFLPVLMRRFGIPTILFCVLFSHLNGQEHSAMHFHADIETFNDILYEDEQKAFSLLEKWRTYSLNCTDRIILNRKYGVYYQKIRYNDKALEYYRDSTLRLQEKCLEQADPAFANIYFNLGVLHRYRFKDFEKAKYYYDLCLDHLENHSQDSNDDSAYYYQFIGSFIRKQGDPGRALYYLQKSKQLYDENPELASIIELHSLFALTYQDLGQLEKSKFHYLERLKLISLPENKKLFERYAHLTNYNIALIYFKQDSLETAKKYTKEAFELSTIKKDQYISFNSLNLLSVIQSKNGLQEKALATLDLSEAYAQSLNQKLYIIENKGDVFFRQKKYDVALDQYEKALLLLSPMGTSSKELLSNQFDNETTGHITRILGLISKSYYHRKRSQDLGKSVSTLSIIDSLNFKRLNRFWVESSKQKLFENGIKDYQWGLLSALELLDQKADANIQSQAYALMSRSKAFLLREATNQHTVYKEILPDSIIQQRKQHAEELQKVQARLQKDYNITQESVKDSLHAIIFDLTRVLEKFDLELNRAYPVLNKRMTKQSLSLTELQSSLDDETLIVEYFCQEDHIFIATISKNQIQLQAVPAFDPAAYCRIQDCPLAEIRAQSANLYALLLNQLDAYASVKKLIVIPDGYLCQIPFESLISPSGNYLIQDYNIYYRYSNDIRRSSKRYEGQSSLLCMGNDYSSHSEMSSTLKIAPGSLPNAPLEAKRISEIFDQPVYINTDATKENFRVRASESQIIHLALHGYLHPENPDQSGILFHSDNGEDAYLSASEVYNLDIDADLAVLSSCHSGQGEVRVADAPRSLARSFLVAGASSVVMSLWQASDASTEKILSDFYQSVKKGESKSTALTLAKRQYLDEASPSLQHPKYWANLVLIGDDQAMSFSSGGFSTYVYLLAGVILIALIYWLRKRGK